MISEYQTEDYNDVVEIFWLTSTKKSFEDESEKAEFQKKYLDYYLNHPQFIGLVFKEDKKVIGYIIGLHLFTKQQISSHPLLKSFQDCLGEYPSELHINFHPDYQGGGKGSHLIQAYEKHVKDNNGNEIFLITLEGARNVNFYLKNNYVIKSQQCINNAELVLMSRSVKN